jgi:histidyl-tRNA synthetase
LLACDAEKVFPGAGTRLDAFVVDVVDGRTGLGLCETLRAAGFAADRALDGRSMKAQMKVADRSGARVAVIIGADEAAAGRCTVKDMTDATQTTIDQSELIAVLSGIVGDRTPRRTQ